ncbi:carbohydrate-binding module family 18 protein [Sporormia fimetaria CBS 119925]|uniref:Carbohydrate-binding module family 18 protein n=1 Tax=Sporormia fimetaria CBS 119925 TaxID=1340428 RepID=A0A6A6VAU5_9PLEO|nr:carbohydrate-binding module family 18 protein [Sporormia fimetaria CBS 119925]
MKWVYIGFAASFGSVTASVLSNSVVETGKTTLHARNADLQSFQKRNATTSSFGFFSRFLTRRQEGGRCGPEGGNARCANNLCCSSYGWCGDAFEYCGEIVGCQPQFGRCGDAPVIPSSTVVPPSSTPTPRPSSSSSSTPVVVPSSTSSTLPPLPSGTLVISPNGQCGNATTCAGSSFGNCCSEFYYCGSGAAYCGTGCRTGFGTCGGDPGGIPGSSSSSPSPTSSPTSIRPPSSSPPPPSSTSSSSTSRTSSTSSARPTPTVPVSTDGRCGNGISCTGSTYGRCCSDYFWCGEGPDYCSPNYGCRPEWGVCGVL